MSGKGRQGGGGGGHKFVYKAKGDAPAKSTAAPNASRSADAEKDRERQEAERLKKEQEAARIEEQKRKEEAELQRQREEKERQEREEAEKIRQEEIKKRREFLFQRSLNIRAEAARPDASFFKQLDSSIKKNSAFIKKIQAKISDENKESLVKEIRQLNLTRYVSELAAAVAQVPLKVSDIEPTVKVCSVIHQLYADFTPQLIPALSKALTAATQSDKEEAMARRRLLLRLICDLFIYGVFTDESVVMSALKELLTTKDKPSQMLTLVISFVRSAGIEILGMIPRGQKKPISIAELVANSGGGSAASTPNAARASNANRGGSKPSGTEADDELFSAVSTESSAPRNVAPVAMEEWESDPLVVEILSAEKSQPFVSVIEKFFDKMCQYMLKEYASLRKIEKANHELLVTKGEVSQSGQEEYEKQKQSFFKLQNNMIQLAELMDRDLPELPDEDRTTRVVTASSDSSAGTSTMENGTSADASEAGSEEALWDDEDTKILYEALPDLKDMVPLVLLGINPAAATTPAQPASDETATSTPAPENAATATPTTEPAAATKEPEKEATPAPETPTTPAPASSESSTTSTSGDASSSSSLANTAASDKLTLFLQQLNKCVNRDMIDQASVDFAYINNRGNRARVVKHMFTVPRTRLDALPYYSRFIATWYPFAKDMGKELVGKLEEEFKQLYAQKDQINIETKVKNIRFLCELVKFRICPTNTIFNCLKMCIDDFKHHNVDVACSLIESCGRFLYRQPETRTRMNTLLEIMMQVKAARNFSPSVELAVENAYYFCKPADRPSFAGKQRAPMHEYIRRLLFAETSKDNTTVILRRLRKLNWNNPEDYSLILRCFLKIHKAKWHNITLIASLAAGLAQFHDDFGVQLVDMLLENIRTLLELHDSQYQQRLVMNIKYLGELYNYQLVDHAAVFSMLYTLITFGHHMKGQIPADAAGDPAASEDDASKPATILPPSEWNPLDMPHESVRARLVCVLLDTCGSYFKRGSTKEKLDRFLIYFQRYLLTKTHMSRDMIFTVDDLFDTLRPRMRRFRTYKEAASAIGQLEDSQKVKNPDYVPIDILMCPPYKIKRPSAASVAAAASSNGADAEEEQDKEFSKEFTEAEPIQVILDDEDAMIAAEIAAEQARLQAEMNAGGSNGSSGAVEEVDPEEEAFAKEFELMVAENREARRNDVALGTSVRGDNNALMATPMSVIKKTIIKTPQALRNSSDHDQDQEAADTAQPEAPQQQQQSDSPAPTNLNFKLLMRKGNKPQALTVEMPSDSKIVQQQLLKRDEERMQKEELKKLTLKLDRMDREEVAGPEGTVPAPVTVQLGPKPYLQTQRGRTNPEYQGSQYQSVYTAASAALRGEDVPMFTVAGAQPSANPNRGRGGYRGGPPRKR
eukprot:TRINITY_DN8213_c0_g1_i1.p1 TRINITY_DN8213_c0_g1~~TRINITY_DN8213_c0_g1_i1.p1  ORF type:complete len:1396 (+),score=384.70 TRINITY_DN8213_c0_g1_i1:24-4190(+)